MSELKTERTNIWAIMGTSLAVGHTPPSIDPQEAAISSGPRQEAVSGRYEALASVRCLADSSHILALDGSAAGFVELPGAADETPSPARAGAKSQQAAGLMMSVAHVMAADPAAVIVVLPASIAAVPSGLFVHYLQEASRVAEELGDVPVVLAAVPHRPEPHREWLRLDGMSLSVAEYVVHPIVELHHGDDAARARRYFHDCYLWKTDVFAVSAQTLWQLGRDALPDLAGQLEQLLSVCQMIRHGRVPEDHGELVTEHLLHRIRTGGASGPRSISDLMRPLWTMSVALPMPGVEWDAPERATGAPPYAVVHHVNLAGRLGGASR